MTKNILRKKILEQQKSLSNSQREQKSKQVTEHLFRQFNFSQSRFINCFLTFEKNNELQTSQIFQRFWCEYPQTTTCAPRIDFETGALENVRFTVETKLVANKWRILEPESNELIEPNRLDVVLVPLIAFDKQGFRVGYGKGFYDKFLKTCRADCQKIGLSLFPQVEKIEDVEDFDVRLDFCVTPQKIWQF